MKTDGGWVSISECARLYGRHRKWVYDQIKRYGIETHKEGNRTRLRLVDLIQHRGEPQNGAPAHNETHTEESQKITPEVTPQSHLEAELVKQENQFLQKRIEELEADRSERQAREARWEEERSRLEGIIERQTYALPSPDQKQGALSRFLHWFTVR